ncbi:MAG: RNA methyltransferase [Candidatus Gastranaerophilales bacterium]|nr:RNA methyltransferase [Candidatus Gastranaerophilales bacterium]
MNKIEITSTQNDLVKFCIKLQNPHTRKSEKLIFIDGEKTLSGLIEENKEFEYIFLKKEDFNPAIKAKNIVFCNDAVLKKISTLKTPTNMAGIIKEPEINNEIFYNMAKIALIDNIKDPGNLGTIIRSACAFSINGIILYGDCVDIYNSKTIRATAQNMFKIPIIKADFEFIKKLKQTHKLIATTPYCTKDFFDYDFSGKTLLAFGSEAQGLSREIMELSDEKLKIFMDNDVESVNLGVFASIAFAYWKHKIKKN